MLLAGMTAVSAGVEDWAGEGRRDQGKGKEIE
jgi:hypothetical protein